MVAITPDAHYGYGVPVGCVILTGREDGAVAMGPVGFDIGCGMMSARSDVPAELATPDRKLAFNRAVMERVAMGAGGKSLRLGDVSEGEFQNLVRGGAEYYVDKYGATFDRSRAERHRIPVEDSWQIPWGGEGRPERGLGQLGSLGGGNHFIELQREEESSTLFVQVHTGSRGFGHGLATNYFAMAKDERHGEIEDIDLGYFTRESRHRGDYLNAVAAGGNFAILNRLMIYEQVAEAFRKVFRADLELVYEISHNLVQAEEHPEFGAVWVHRKGATRAFPAGHPALAGTIWQDDGPPGAHPRQQPRPQLHPPPPRGAPAQRLLGQPRRGAAHLARRGDAGARPAQGQRAVPPRRRAGERRRGGSVGRVGGLLQARKQERARERDRAEARSLKRR
jgi:tRNA-splicing ligase RtcB